VLGAVLVIQVRCLGVQRACVSVGSQAECLEVLK
jgi:hypothetical protein